MGPILFITILIIYREFHVADATENYKLSFKNGSYSGDAGY